MRLRKSDDGEVAKKASNVAGAKAITETTVL
jgi:hypothetical protein